MDNPDDPDHRLSQQEHQMLHRVDERTERMDNRMDRIVAGQERNADDIDDLQENVGRNTTILNGLTLGVSGALSWVFGKLGGLI